MSAWAVTPTPEQAVAVLGAWLRIVIDAYHGREDLSPGDLDLARRIEEGMYDAEHDAILDAGVPTDQIEELHNRSVVQRYDAALVALHLLPRLLDHLHERLDDLARDALRLAQTIDTEHRAEIERIAAGLSLDARQARSLAAAFDGIEPEDA
jgi:hypothetical protein